MAVAADRRVAELEARLAYLEDLVVTDELTGALNRRGFVMEFTRALDAARRGGPRGVVIVCDLDGFKTINDRLGHAVGDEVLRQVGRLLIRGVRRMDVTARLGGDEFALLLIGADLAAAAAPHPGLRARHRRDCAALRHEHPSPERELRSRRVRRERGRGDGLHRADMTMYAEKRHGGERRGQGASRLPAPAALAARAGA